MTRRLPLTLSIEIDKCLDRRKFSEPLCGGN
jgi:hypothetical protein